MENTLLIKISSEGQTLESIANKYLEYIDDDFDLTIDEMATYLRCGYDYARKNIAEHLHHIYINSTARKALNEYARGYDREDLYSKRKLYSRSEFHRFLVKDARLLVGKTAYYLDDLSPSAQEKLEVADPEKKTSPEKQFKSMAMNHIQQAYPQHVLIKDDEQEDKITQIPEALYSLKDLLTGIEDPNIQFQYKTEMYRYLNTHAIPKLKIQSLIRYRKEDLMKLAAFSLPLAIDKKRLLSSMEEALSQ